ncbi:MAG: IMP dehydrogenase [bacterium]|nr:IMP dehydrogenase [bacterium]
MYELTPEEKDAIREYLERKGLPTQLAVTFRDVREIPPREWEEVDAVLTDDYSDIRSRSEINDFRAVLAGNLVLNIPLVSANMQSVTGDELATELAKEGGMGFLPQMLPIKDRVSMIDKIRRADCAFIKHPLSIAGTATLAEAKALMNESGIYSLVVVTEEQDNKRPIGILSTRDWKYEIDQLKLVRDLMNGGGKTELVSAPRSIPFEDARQLLHRKRVEKLPLLDDQGLLAGLLTAHGLFYTTHHPRALRDENGRFLAAASVGVGQRFTDVHRKEVEIQLEHGACVILLDTARAFSVNAREALVAVLTDALEDLKKRFPNVPIIVGNTCSAKGTKFLFENGADAVKINQGRGSRCITSRVTGVGVAQLTAIAESSVIARKYGKCIIGDGGMDDPIDFIKAIAAGANTLMTGSFFAGTHESLAEAHMGEGRLVGSEKKFAMPVKEYFGEASPQSQRLRIQQKTLDRERKAEGKSEPVPVTGTVRERVTDALDSFRSAMSYVGARTLGELREKAVFRLQTSAARLEGLK